MDRALGRVDHRAASVAAATEVAALALTDARAAHLDGHLAGEVAREPQVQAVVVDPHQQVRPVGSAVLQLQGEVLLGVPGDPDTDPAGELQGDGEAGVLALGADALVGGAVLESIGPFTLHVPLLSW